MRQVGLGLVSQVFGKRGLEQIRGRAAIGHVRYSTTGSSTAANSQPLLFSFAGGQVAIAHNGNLINAALLRRVGARCFLSLRFRPFRAKPSNPRKEVLHEQRHIPLVFHDNRPQTEKMSLIDTASPRARDSMRSG